MACCSVRVTALVVFFVVCVTTGDADFFGELQCYTDAYVCVSKGVYYPSKPDEAINFPAVIEKVCRRFFYTCTRNRSLDECPQKSRAPLLALETALQKTSDALCQNDASLFKDTILPATCFSWGKFTSCLNEMDIRIPYFAWLHNLTQESLDAIKADISTCIRRSRKDTAECKAADFGPVNKSFCVDGAPCFLLPEGATYDFVFCLEYGNSTSGE
ncbi:uncharacterized protein LOC144169007 [Haemaphysalis longicornis]